MGLVLVNGIVVGSIYGLFAVGLVLVYNGSRVINFAQAELGTFALFLTWGLTNDLETPRLSAAIVAVLAVAVLSLIFERLVIRPLRDAPRLTVTVATVGLSLFLVALEAFIWGASPRSMPSPFQSLGPKILGVFVGPIQWIAIATLIVLALGLGHFLRRTDFGLGVLASAQDPTAARLVGVRFADVSAFTWMVGGVLGAVAALLVQPSIGGFGVGFMTGSFFVPALTAALIGGLHSVQGALVGGLVVGLIDQGAQKYLSAGIPGAQILALFVIILLVLLIRPQGLLTSTTST